MYSILILTLFLESAYAFQYQYSDRLDYMKFREFNMVSDGLENTVDSSFPNVEIFIKWSSWSCCSACCCPKSVCRKFETSGDKCNSVKSYQNRRGDFMVRRKGPTGNNGLEILFNKGPHVKLLEALKILEIHLQLDNSRISLTEKLNVAPETLAVFQTKNCKDHIQKLDCWVLAKCLYNSTDMLPEKEIAKIDERDVCENASIFVLRDAYNILSLMPEKLYKLQIDRKIVAGNIVNVNYTIDGEVVKKLNHVRDCEYQKKRVFQHPNGEDLIVRLTEEQLSKNPKIIAVISLQQSARLEIRVDMVLKTKRKRDKESYDAIIIGGGHNGLTAAAYLAKAGKKVCVLERRHVLGGAAVTEEIVPGFRFSRASYLLSLLRPVVMQELNLKKFGLRYHIRNPNSFTPIRDTHGSLTLGMDMAENQREIAKFSKADAENYPKYEHFISEVTHAFEQLMDYEPLDLQKPIHKMLPHLYLLYKAVQPLGLKNAVDFYELMTAPISKIMNKWFESDVLKATLGTDGVIGLAASPMDPGTGYVLLHHVIGGLDEHKGAWGYVVGGMGAVSNAIAECAKSHGVEIFTEQEVDEVLLDGNVAKGVRLANGREIHSKIVMSNATPHVTFNNLVKKEHLPADFYRSVSQIDYTSPVTKINVAVKELPNFLAKPNLGSEPMPHHQTTIHMNCENMQVVHDAVLDYKNGRYSRRPVIEMTIPSSIDRTIVDSEDGHVVLLFTQYTPFSPKDHEWTEEKKTEYAKHVFSEIDAYAPNFSSSVIGYDILTPPDIQNTFGITGGNIFHGSMSLDQLYTSRPVSKWANYSTPIKSLYLCGSGAHPGGGVTGAPGRLSALHALKHF
ncbi:hypothetical protein L5515_012306 [Caenorhabditis briggsae]|uniref:Pyridine nucleotide-disulfide oxidoreductase domain-containing protein 2 n=1 Tax=Caenorhabditis briggsae TaxID=6238 RepID=A0AAE9EVL0_CAEBR|nr:hypothetical protein L5515_012306 [Caenorhabditis briggsae]